jgi:hypothetical protein
MSEKLYRVADRDAIARLRTAGACIVHRFPGGVVLAKPLDRAIDGVTEVDPDALAIPTRLQAEDIGELAFALRQSPAFRARKAGRPHVGESIDDIIAGTAGQYP